MRRLVAALALLAPAFVAGCGEKTVSMPSPVSASGKVTLASGEPVSDVRIVFEPVDARAAASAEVKGGSFSLSTYDKREGACPGKYRVVFRVVQRETHADYKRSEAALKAIPAKYKDENSPLQVEVPSGGKTDFVLKLDAK